MRQPPLTSPTRKQPDRQPFVPSSALRHFAPTHPKTGGCPSSTSGGRRQKACAKTSDMGAATPKGPGWRILPKFAATRFSRRAPVCMRLRIILPQKEAGDESLYTAASKSPSLSRDKSVKRTVKRQRPVLLTLHIVKKARTARPVPPRRSSGSARCRARGAGIHKVQRGSPRIHSSE